MGNEAGFPRGIAEAVKKIQDGWNAGQRDAARKGARRLSSATVPARTRKRGK